VEITAVEEPPTPYVRRVRGGGISDLPEHLGKRVVAEPAQKYPVVLNEQEVAALTK
jgi:hypothetical protein